MSASSKSIQHLARLTDIAISLNAEHDYGHLLEMILKGARELTGSDGGTLYILGTKDDLHFALMETESLGISGRYGLDDSIPPPIPLYDAEGTPNTGFMVTRAIFENRIINIPDTYASDEYNFSGTHAFDRRTGYRSRSMLTIPLKNHREKLIGVMQLINALHPKSREIIPFSRDLEYLARAFASLTATILTQKNLVDGLEDLLQSLIRLVATAIDEKSPYTGGHCRRVPILTMMLAKAVNEQQVAHPQAPLLDKDALYELEMAAWLHDCGKISTPEHIIDKRSKLETIFDRIELINAKFEILRREVEIEYLESRVKALQTGDPARPAEIENQRRAKQEQIESDRDFLARCNLGNEFMAEHDRQRVRALGEIRIRSGVGTSIPLLSEDEIKNLTIAKGTLTEEERARINYHIIVTRNMLEALPFPEHLRKIPIIAGGHHEHMNGTGYPEGLTRDQLPIQTRILAIADIFEALTARDRPYRKTKTLSETLQIMEDMAKQGHIDPDLYSLFLREKVYLKFATAHLSPDQIDIG